MLSTLMKNNLNETLSLMRALDGVGLNPLTVTGAERLQRREGRSVWRIGGVGPPLILKWTEPDGRTATAAPFTDEGLAYRLLEELGVPTPVLYLRSGAALLLEDLAAHRRWRLATAADVDDEATGWALAEWYRALHGAGRRLPRSPDGQARHLAWNYEALNANVIMQIGETLGLADHRVWPLAADRVGALKLAARSRPLTLVYNDFHWSNLALTRHENGEELRHAMLFDYHLLGLGLAASDWHNVTGGLGERARASFIEAYGRPDPAETILDRPLAILHALRVASKHPRRPAWARELVDGVLSGTLEREIQRALEVARA